VVTLKERRVSLVGTTNYNNRSKEREGRDRKLEVKRLSEMGKGIRRKSAPAAVVSKAASNSVASNAKDVIEDKPGDLILTQKQSMDTTASNTTTSNTSTIPNNNTQNNNTASDTIQKKVGGRPAKSRTSITNVNNSLYQGAILNPLKCPHCSKDFLSEKGLQYHVGKFNIYVVLFVLFWEFVCGGCNVEGY